MNARRIWSIVAAVVVVGVVAALAIMFWPAPAAPTVAPQQATPQLVARGQYLATAADCVACHTTAGGQAYAGGRAFKLPFGTLYSPNITPDRATGIGAWTDGEFLRAVHKGVGKEGEQLYPAFPYTSYAAMTDADALAIKAYLFTLAPVRSPVRENGLVFPFNQRPIMRFWKILFMPRHGFEGDRGQSQQWNRGKYLVTALGHCGECHTPRNLMYGLETSKALSGESIQGWTAWNITSDARHGIGAWSTDEIAAYLAHGYSQGRGAASGPMKEAVDYSLSKLAPADIQAMAVYLKTVPGKARGPVIDLNPVSLSSSTFTEPPTAERAVGKGGGQRIFEGACASCHAWNGQGQQWSAAALRGLSSVNDPKGLNVVQTVLHGGNVATPQGRAFMPAFGAEYSDAEIAAVSNYVIGHFSGQDGSVTPADVAKARKQ
jgi:mono/diheme cytochrome c family protein